jgi:hypothetical protein
MLEENIYVAPTEVLLDNQANICIHHCFTVRDFETEGCWWFPDDGQRKGDVER